MDHNVNLITTLALGFGLALVFGVLAERVKLPALIGYLFAGVVLGPLTPGEAVDRNIASQLSEVGVMLLMFGVGLHFSFKDLMEVRKIAIPGAVFQMVATTTLSTSIAHFAMKLPWHSAAVLGFCLSCASTVVLLKTLEAKNQMGTMNGRIAVGWLIVEDMITVLALVLLPAIAGVVTHNINPRVDHVAVVSNVKNTPLTDKVAEIFLEEVVSGATSITESVKGTSSSSLSSDVKGSSPKSALTSPDTPKSSSESVQETPSFVTSVFKTLLSVGTFMGIMLVAGKKFLPWVLYQVSKTGSRELFTLSVVSIVIGIAYGASVLFQVSFALGAFIAGMVMRESEFSHRAAEESMPLRDAFAVLFFVSVGLLLDFKVMLRHPVQLFVLVSIVLFFKPLVSTSLALFFKYPVRTALTLGVSLAQIGEFSFIFAGAAVGLGLITQDIFSILVAVSIISIAFNPLMLSLVEPISFKLVAKFPRIRSLEISREEEVLEDLPPQIDIKTLVDHVILVGHGHVGTYIANDLKAQGMTVVVVEQNRDRVVSLRKSGSLVVHGDGCDVTSLDIAHVEKALAMIIATKDVVSVPEMVRQARLINSGIKIVIKCRNEDEWRLLTNDLGHHQNINVVWAEEELAKNVASNIQEMALKKRITNMES